MGGVRGGEPSPRTEREAREVGRERHALNFSPVPRVQLWGTDTCLTPPELSEVLETGWPSADRVFQGEVAPLGLAITQVQEG